MGHGPTSGYVENELCRGEKMLPKNNISPYALFYLTSTIHMPSEPYYPRRDSRFARKSAPYVWRPGPDRPRGKSTRIG
jgi:hypothetical protein